MWCFSDSCNHNKLSCFMNDIKCHEMSFEMSCNEWNVTKKVKFHEIVKLKCFSVKWMFFFLKKNAFAFSVIEVAASFLSQHWLADVSLFCCSEIIIENPSTVVTIFDNAIFWMNDHISSTDSEENRDYHNEFHFEELFVISV